MNEEVRRAIFIKRTSKTDSGKGGTAFPLPSSRGEGGSLLLSKRNEQLI